MAQTAPPPGRRRRLRRAAWGLLALTLLAVLAIGGLATWIWRSETGAAWVLSQVPGLRIEGQRGSFSGGPFEAARLELDAGGRKITIDGLSWRDLRWDWRPPGGAWLGVELIEPRARRVDLGSAPSSTEPLAEPARLRLPVALRIDGLAVDVLKFDPAQPPLTDLQADLHLGDDQGAVHRIHKLHFDWDRLSAEVQGRLGADAPLPLSADVQLRSRGDAATPWSATVQARGPLARLEVDAALAGGAAPDAPHVNARATVTPFTAWPLAALSTSTDKLDLSALAAGLPATRLSGKADIRSSSLDQPVQADISLRNALPGRWDEARLPIEDLQLSLQGVPSEPDTLTFRRFDITLAQGAGRVTGDGRWQRDTLELALRLTGLRPHKLDGRLAAMALEGSLQLGASGLPSPTGAAAGATLRADVQAELSGRVEAAPASSPRITLRTALGAERSADRLLLDVRELSARSGEARAEGRAVLTLLTGAGKSGWTATSRGELRDFDPLPWFPGPDGPGWRRGPHRLTGSWNLDLGGPAPDQRPPLDQLLALRGDAALTLRDSRLAGVPVQGRATLRSSGGLAVQADVEMAGNQLKLDGQLAPRPNDDRWRLELKAPALGALAPLATLHPALPAALPRAGSISGQASAQGRWPLLSSSGALNAKALQLDTVRVAGADMRWQWAGSADAPLSLQLDVDGAAIGEKRLDSLRAQLDGTLRAHRLTVDASSPLRAPDWAHRLRPAPAASAATPGQPVAPPAASPGSALRARVEGAWTPGASPASGLANGRWTGRLLELDARERGATTPWMAARDIGATVQFDGAGQVDEARAEPGRLSVLDAALRWREAHWQAGGPASTGARPARLSLEAELEPLAIAPLLARLQPDFGWGGDLKVQGRFLVSQGAGTFGADVVLERTGGDLVVTDDAGSQALGLTDLRLALNAQDGTWHFTQAAAGANLGVLAGAQSLRVARDAAWPGPETPLEGVLEWRVANLGVWAPFAPPGWRLAGSLRTSASLGGRFGAPTYTGEMVGSGLGLRNLLEGVNVRDGELAVTLRGDDARIERFRFKGGDGELRLEGGASFGAEPRAQLRLMAERFQLLGRFDRRIVTSGTAELVLQKSNLQLDGRFKVDEGLFDFTRADAPSLDDDVTVRRRGVPVAKRDPAPAPAAAGPLRNAKVVLEVDLGDELSVRGRGLDTKLRGRLTITTPDGRLAVNGSVRTEAGTYAAYGQKLDIERGVLRFAGSAENPRLDILAIRANTDVRVGVLVAGTAANPRVRLFSEPDMSDTDKLSWLVLGRGPDGLGRTETALLQRAALALLAGGGEAPSDALMRNIGLDEFSLSQKENGDVRETVVTLGKQLSSRWYVGYERGVNATTGTWQLIYRIAQRFTLRAQSGNDNALDVIWTWRWDAPKAAPTIPAKPP